MAIQFVCPLCGGQITIPSAGLETSGPDSAPRSGRRQTIYMVLAVVGVLAFLCCGGGALVFYGQAAGKRAQATQNLDLIGLALRNYHHTHNALPPAVIYDQDGKPLYSGRVLLTPFLGRGDIYDRFNKSKAWDSPENLAVSQQMKPSFQDPASPSTNPDRCDFVFVTGPGTLFDGEEGIAFSEVTDGLSSTIAAVGTTSGPNNWAAPTDWNIDSGVVPGSHHSGKLLVLFADGKVRLMKTHYFRENMRALSSRSSRDILPPER